MVQKGLSGIYRERNKTLPRLMIIIHGDWYRDSRILQPIRVRSIAKQHSSEMRTWYFQSCPFVRISCSRLPSRSDLSSCKCCQNPISIMRCMKATAHWKIFNLKRWANKQTETKASWVGIANIHGSDEKMSSNWIQNSRENFVVEVSFWLESARQIERDSRARLVAWKIGLRYPNFW